MSTATAMTLLLLAPLATAGPAPAEPPPPPPCTASNATCLEKVAALYLEALRSHDGSKLPLAPDVRRSENALTNARGPREVRESFARTGMVQGTRNARFYVDAGQSEVVVFFLLDVDLKAADAGATTRAGDTEYKVAVSVPEGTYTVHEVERFRVVNGLITEIEIIAHVENGKGEGSGWPVARDPVVNSPPAQR